MAAVDEFRIDLEGVQTHGSTPWTGIDPIVIAAQIVNNIQTIVSRSLPLTEAGAVVTIGSIHGGVRSNIIPESLYMLGTIRTLDEAMKATVLKKIRGNCLQYRQGQQRQGKNYLPGKLPYHIQ